MSQTTTETSTATTPEPTMDPMMAGGLGLTPVAAEKVVEIRKAEDIEDSYSLRVKVIGGEGPQDQAFGFEPHRPIAAEG